jgi:Lrp/AsnC family leucine-responsive transcriptional regulator
MDLEIEKLLDPTGWRLLSELQQNARLTYRELGQRVGLSSPAVAERIQRMEAAGIIRGYHIELDLERLGLPIQAMVHLRELGGRSCDQVAAQLEEMPEVREIYRITGDDSMMARVAARSVDELTRVLDRFSEFGVPDTSILRSAPTRRLLNNSQDDK